MKYRQLGDTSVNVSIVSFGAGPVAGLMTGDRQQHQLEVIESAIRCGINWFDTAATYGRGLSEKCLGQALETANRRLPGARTTHLATKVRLENEDLQDVAGAIERSLTSSLARLRADRVTLLQLHNSVTQRRGQLPTSLEPCDVVGEGGVLDCMQRLQQQGMCDHLGFTGLGDPASLRRLAGSGGFATVQLPVNLLNTTAIQGSAPHEVVGPGTSEQDYGGLASFCAARGMGVFAIRVFAGGAIADSEPSRHTFTTRFFSLDLYRQDRARAAAISSCLPTDLRIEEAAVRFACWSPPVTSAIIGFADAEQIQSACQWSDRGPLTVA